MRAELEFAGEPIEASDVLIAAQARRRDATVVTSNVGEFDRITGLKWEEGRLGGFPPLTVIFVHFGASADETSIRWRSFSACR